MFASMFLRILLGRGIGACILRMGSVQFRDRLRRELR